MLSSPFSAIAVALLLVVPSGWSAETRGTETRLATGGAPAASVAVWDWPLPGPHTLLRPYIAPETPYSAGHRGIDIEAHTTTEATPQVVTAPAAGTVYFAGFVVDRPVLSIRHPGGIISSFEPVSTTLAIGDVVRAGQEIGTLEVGHCSSLCLHLGVRINGSYVSPLLFLGGVPRAVLLPTRFPK
jgi:murein DD-endopeptidase MepM/ murein hydrolase activator NlpD